MNPHTQNEWQREANRYRAPQIILELELETQAGSALFLLDLEDELSATP